jgi:amidohydrolase
MLSRDELKARVISEIDAHADELINIATNILEHPETGFNEEKTSRLVIEKFRELRIRHRQDLAVTGVKGEVLGASEGPTVAVIGELDSLIVGDHPHADPNTGAAHACGHHAQIGMMLGAAMSLSRPEILGSLSGRIVFMAVPAEEFIEIERRDGLRREGKIEFLGGKAELIRLGEFDDIHIAMMCHTTSNRKDGMLCMGDTHNGMLAKKVQFIGRGAHAGGAPHLGINALNAASLALMAIHANRETFCDEDTVRVHPIITKGGEAVSAVPADVRMEAFVRGRTIDAVMQASRKVDRALKAGAMAVGARVKIQTLPGYLPMQEDRSLANIFRANAASQVGDKNVGSVEHRTGSTDMGDVSYLMPTIHPYVGGATGLSHGSDYVIDDYQLSVITAAKVLATTVVDLLAEGANQGNGVIAGHQPEMVVSEYLRFVRGLNNEEIFVP